ncbi:MAG: hypothetical protein WCC39_13260 [Telluria sp.]
MNKNMIFILAAAAAMLMMSKQARATAPAGSASAPVKSTNVNDQLWSSLLGNGWKALRDAQTDTGGAAFLERNFLGQVVTSDGKPVGQEYQDLAPTTYGNFLPVDLGGASGGVDYLAEMGW